MSIKVPELSYYMLSLWFGSVITREPSVQICVKGEHHATQFVMLQSGAVFVMLQSGE